MLGDAAARSCPVCVRARYDDPVIEVRIERRQPTKPLLPEDFLGIADAEQQPDGNVRRGVEQGVKKCRKRRQADTGGHEQLRPLRWLQGELAVRPLRLHRVTGFEPREMTREDAVFHAFEDKVQVVAVSSRNGISALGLGAVGRGENHELPWCERKGGLWPEPEVPGIVSYLLVGDHRAELESRFSELAYASGFHGSVALLFVVTGSCRTKCFYTAPFQA